MPCVIVPQKAQTYSELLYDTGLLVEAGGMFGREPLTDAERTAQARQYKASALEIKGTVRDHPCGLNGGAWFMCGEGLEACMCGGLSVALCDYPMGKGKTCDLALCDRCGHHVAEDTDLCLLHFHEWRGKAGIEEIRPWPPL